MVHNAMWSAQAFVVAPEKSRQGYTAAITDRTGGSLGSCDSEGVVRDASGTVLFAAPVRWESPRNKPLHAEFAVSDASGQALGSGRVVKYGIGPRSKKATISVTDPEGNEVIRLEPTDKKGEQLGIGTTSGQLATIAVEEFKAGFLKKGRRYTVALVSAVPEALRPLLFATAIRYDAILDAVAAAAMRDSVRD